jgi:hypothetical protein
MAYNSPAQVSYEIKRSIDGKTTGSTLLFTPAANFTPLMINFEVTSTTGFVTVSSCSIGTNGASYNNILPISALTGAIAASNILNFSLLSLISKVASGTGIYVNVTTGAVATTYVLKITLVGFYD